METILGVVMVYAWIHGAIIAARARNMSTQYENGVMIAALVGASLYIFGTM